MPRGGKRPGAGRKPGSPNLATIARQAAVAATGEAPLDVLLAKMRWHKTRADQEIAKGELGNIGLIEACLDKASEAAKDAASYVHPRLATMAHTGSNGGPIQTMDWAQLSDTQLAALEPVLTILAAGSTATDDPLSANGT